MDISINLGIFFSLYFLVAGLAMLVNGKFLVLAADDILANRGLMVLTGFMALMFGLLIISFHGYYGFRWPVLITFIGWLSFLKGVLYLISEQTIHKISSYYKNNNVIRINGVIALIFCVFFAYNVMQ